MTSREKVLRIVIAVVAALLIVWTVTPVFTGVVSVGMLICAPLVLIFLLAAFPALHNAFRRRRGLHRAGVAIFAAGALVFTLAGSLMLYGANRTGGTAPGTVIVLGSRIYGEQPGRALTRRLDAALGYLDAHPDCDVIVTGGQAGGEDISNAEAMRRYLVAHGIDDSRIYTEPAAHSTGENLAFSRAIIDANGLSADAVIVTDGYHQFRAFLFARKADISCAPVSCATHWTEIPSSFVRETLAIYRLLLLGY